MRPLLLTLLLATAALGGAAGCGGPPGGGPPGEGPGQPGAEPDKRLLVEVSPAETGSVADYLETSGVIESEAQADITPEATGILTQLNVEEGDAVKRGQVLAVLENPSLDAGADRALIELERAEADRAKAQQLHAQGVISEQELRAADLALRAAQAGAREARRTRGFTRIVSPIDGTVALREGRIGEVVGGRPLFQVVDLARLRVIVQLPEKDLPRVRVGQPVQLSGAYDESAAAQGQVERVSPVVDPATGTVRVTVRVLPGQEALRPGQFVKARVEVDRHSDVLTIPRRALVWEDGAPVAWVVADAPPEEKGEEPEGEEEPEEGGIFAKIFGGEEKAGEAAGEGEEPAEEGEDIPRRIVQRRELEIGFSDPERVEILSGVTAGDPVVVVGNRNLRDGAAVRLPTDPVPKAKAEGEGEEGGEKEGGSG